MATAAAAPQAVARKTQALRTLSKGAGAGEPAHESSGGAVAGADETP